MPKACIGRVCFLPSVACPDRPRPFVCVSHVCRVSLRCVWCCGGVDCVCVCVCRVCSRVRVPARSSTYTPLSPTYPQPSVAVLPRVYALPSRSEQPLGLLGILWHVFGGRGLNGTRFHLRPPPPHHTKFGSSTKVRLFNSSDYLGRFQAQLSVTLLSRISSSL